MMRGNAQTLSSQREVTYQEYLKFYEHVNSHKKQMDRKCLKCGSIFLSKHFGNRLCIGCFTKNNQLKTNNLNV